MSKYLVLVISGVSAAAAFAQPAGEPLASEQDFLADMPIVLSVSRLAQRLDDTPGAVTILDRQAISNSGARTVVDLLRLVPGFQVTNSFETDAPMATYHGRTDDWANRIQVLVDGRSVYSSALQGSAGVGWQTLALDDIERIEVLRGSNSATYGARAFLGVVNIVSRDVRATLGSAAFVAAGENGIADAGARIGWGNDSQAYRLSVDSQGDNGLRGAFGHNRTSRVNFSTHWMASDTQEMGLRAGTSMVNAGRGTEGDAGNNARHYQTEARYLQLDWRRQLGVDQDIAVTASHTFIDHRDSFPYLDTSLDHFDQGVAVKYFGIPIDFGGMEYNNVISLQSTTRHASTLRTVWGGELRNERLVSRSSFDARESVATNYFRAFGNAEWRQAPNLVWNAGALVESSDIAGNSISPRVMLNWHVDGSQTLRVGASNAFRPPTAFEKYAVVRYYDTNGRNPITTVENRGGARSEKVLSQELGYFFVARSYDLSGDVRIFRETVKDGVAHTGSVSGQEYINGDHFRIQGVEYQLKWKPLTDTHIVLGQTSLDIDAIDLVDSSTQFRVEHGAPRLSSSLSVTQTLPRGYKLLVQHQQIDDTALMSDANRHRLFSMRRTDIRLAKELRWGKTKAELAFTVHSAESPYQDSDWQFWFDRRAFVTLRLEN